MNHFGIAVGLGALLSVVGPQTTAFAAEDAPSRLPAVQLQADLRFAVETINRFGDLNLDQNDDWTGVLNNLIPYPSEYATGGGDGFPFPLPADCFGCRLY